MSSSRRRAIIGAEVKPANRLPSGYTEYDFIYASGYSSVISFNLQWNNIARMVVKLRKTSTTANIMLYNSGSGITTPFIAYSRDNGVSTTFTPRKGTMLDLDWHEFTITISSTSTNKISTSSWDGAWWERIDYGEQVFYDSSDNIIGDFVPCYSSSDNLYGFYDLTTNTFNGNANFTGESK